MLYVFELEREPRRRTQPGLGQDIGGAGTEHVLGHRLHPLKDALHAAGVAALELVQLIGDCLLEARYELRELGAHRRVDPALQVGRQLARRLLAQPLGMVTQRGAQPCLLAPRMFAQRFVELLRKRALDAAVEQVPRLGPGSSELGDSLLERPRARRQLLERQLDRVRLGSPLNPIAIF